MWPAFVITRTCRTTGDDDQAEQLQALRAAHGALDFFCINDTTDDAHASDPRLANARTTLQAMLGSPSRMERDVSSPLTATRAHPDHA